MDALRIEHDQDRIVGIDDRAVVHVQQALVFARDEPAVFVGDLEGLRLAEKIVRALGLEHIVDDAGILVGMEIELFETENHLLGRELRAAVKIGVRRCADVHAHVGSDALAKLAVTAHGLPHAGGHIVVGVDDGPLLGALIVDAADRVGPLHGAVRDLFGIVHIQRHLVHAAGDHIHVAPEVVLLAGHGVVITGRDALVEGAVLIHQPPEDLLPAAVGKARIVGGGGLRLGRVFGQGAGRERQCQAQRQRQAQPFLKNSHLVHLLRKELSRWT